MKILTAQNIFFKLPDRFKGTVPDALRLLADYIEAETPPLKESAVELTDPWDRFQDVLACGGRLSGNSTVQKLVKGKAWEIMDDAGRRKP